MADADEEDVGCDRPPGAEELLSEVLVGRPVESGAPFRFLKEDKVWGMDISQFQVRMFILWKDGVSGGIEIGQIHIMNIPFIEFHSRRLCFRFRFSAAPIHQRFNDRVDFSSIYRTGGLFLVAR